MHPNFSPPVAPLQNPHKPLASVAARAGMAQVQAQPIGRGVGPVNPFHAGKRPQSRGAHLTSTRWVDTGDGSSTCCRQAGYRNKRELSNRAPPPEHGGEMVRHSPRGNHHPLATTPPPRDAKNPNQAHRYRTDWRQTVCSMAKTHADLGNETTSARCAIHPTGEQWAPSTTRVLWANKLWQIRQSHLPRPCSKALDGARQIRRQWRRPCVCHK